MKLALSLLLRLFAFWLLFFALFRIWFVMWFRQEWSPEAPWYVMASFWHAIPLDLSMAGYLAALPILLWFVGLGLGTRFYSLFENLINGFNILIFSILVFIFGANVFIYEEWHTLLNNRALEYFKTPAALLDSMSLPFKIACVALYLAVVWVFLRLYRKIIGSKIYDSQTSRWPLAALPLWLGILFLAIRGGFGVMPINESAVYYSSHIFDNHAATNTAWHLIHGMVETRSTENHYRFLDETRAKNALTDLFPTQASQSKASFFEKKDSASLNLIFIIMESHTAQVMESLGGEKGVCPTLERLVQEGILFTNCYGSGYRTDQGIVSVLAGYPAQPDQSIVLLEDKAARLNSVPKILKTKGYRSAFFYGGELTFANIGTWLRNQRFDKIFSEKDFNSAEKTQRWGVDDKILLQRVIPEIKQLEEPFFVTAMTLSLHPPYDVPYQSSWQGTTDREKFLNSAAFADYALEEFFKVAAQQSWYENTLFVLVADHGASLPSGEGMDRPITRHLPWIIYGKPLKHEWQGKKMESICNHHDIPATILGMMNLSNSPDDFPWSRDLWSNNLNNPSEKSGNRFAYFTNENGIGWINSTGKGFFYFEDQSWKFWEATLDSSAQTQAKAYIQLLYEDFLQK
jgi:phosphoglycerol transferase MdoB-like AlkP superfamily enzyme